MESLNYADWGRPALLALAVVAAALLAHRVARRVVTRLVRFSVLLTAMVRRCDRPSQWALPLAALQILWQGLPESLPMLGAVIHTSGVLLIVSLTWFATGIVRGIAEGVIERHPATVADNLQARRIHTQTRVLARIATGVLVIAGVAFVLMTFPRARQFGASLLASAGVAGLIVGLAAKSVFSNLLAGLQIALTQPFRLDDVLIVEGEWGRVEEIKATYVVLKIWDERRLVVPLQWFIEHPFQNWTRQSADILGTVFLWFDYALPVDALRDEAQRLCRDATEWDGRVCAVQVTDASDRSMQLRILVSSASSGLNFDLRCRLREGLISYVRREHPQALPRLRAQIGGELQAPSPDAGPATPAGGAER